MQSIPHQYIDRKTGALRTEKLFGDTIVRQLYSAVRENAPALYRALISRRTSGLLGWLNYDLQLGAKLSGNRAFLAECGVDASECLDDIGSLDTARKVFERKIRYWDCRPMPAAESTILSPADARMLLGSFRSVSQLFLKNKFFDLAELLGPARPELIQTFAAGDFAIFRLTPDKYHYNHAPVSGIVFDHYEIDGDYHSCNPSSVIAVATPFSKNRRTVTVIDTDVPGGSNAGLVAMVEVTALMIGQVVQCYSADRYDNPKPVVPGMFLKRGAPKSLYRPGSSTDVLLFQRGRINFDADLRENMARAGAMSRFSAGFGQPLVETEVEVRSRIGVAVPD